MEYFLRKIWLSAVLSILILVTCVTSTYAWYAMTRTNNIENFDFDIKGGDSLAISTDGVEFVDSLSSVDVKRAILQKRGISTSGLSEDKVDSLLNIMLEPITPNDYTDLSKGFKYLNNRESSEYKYISFDIYITTNNDNFDRGTRVRLSTKNPIIAKNKFVDFKDLHVNDNTSLGKISDGVIMNTANAMRIGLITYDVCKYSDLLNSSLNPKTTIYSIGGNKTNIIDGVYNFGGINSEYNLAVDLYNQRSDEKIVIPDYDRNDVDYDTVEIVSDSEGLTAEKMKKITVFLWLEGWDADCIDEIKGEKFTLELGMSSIV